MRKYLVFMALGIAALWLVSAGGGLLGSGPMAAAYTRSAVPPGVALPFAGTWFFHNYVGDSPTWGPLIGTVNVDGTLVISGTPMGGGMMCSDVHGSWKATGRNTMVGTFLCIVTDFDGHPLFYEKGSLEWTLSEDGNELGGLSVINLYGADVDPLVGEPFGMATCTGEGRRVAAE